jgi:hypothetical protein
MSVETYRKRHRWCEACARLEGAWPVEPVEIHHIQGRISNDDWNLIAICREHHRRGTHHDLEHGTSSREWNGKFLAIKAVKGEITEDRLNQIHMLDVTRSALQDMFNGETYWDGKRKNWYER